MLRCVRRTLVVVVASIIGLACAPGSGFGASEPGAAAAVATYVQSQVGTPTSLYTNCPTDNTIGGGFVCEFRTVVPAGIVVGTALATPSGGTYAISGAYFDPPAPVDWQPCSNRLGHRNHARTITLVNRGLGCEDLPLNLSDARFHVSEKNRKIDHAFRAGGRGTNTLGFEIFIYNCVGQNLSRKRRHAVYLATCSNIFGDGFAYKFRVVEPKPKRVHHHSGGGSGGSGGGESGGGSCEPGYSPCLPVTEDLDCDQIPDSKKPVTVTGSDPYDLDSDGDGVGCET